MMAPTPREYEQRITALEAQVRALREPHYLSTACWHEKHDQCRKECKFCGRKCHCECHVLTVTELKEQA